MVHRTAATRQDPALSSAEDDKSRWNQVMENFDVLFARVNDIGVIQRELKPQMEQNNLKVDKCSEEQQSFISMQLLEDEEKSIGSDSASLGTKNCPS